ncbi:alpha/beta fold hydrolase [Nocardioides jiangxiensis]|uniref:Alpha/beta fold hydrolase n=1 Tax=Nocardioides jiangxiensis TaxID=3064524 RepID=A0ABT9B2Y6_9ACTN|nr:alpha/beta fold hydrolase [Nocardioides sp. WY-20]MDO7867977.1 alpha/beta fold hydrolase [Nocardioides sp. WY-20]
MLAHERHGAGSPIVLIHGIGHRRQGWDPIVPLLVAEGHEVITVDLPGHGESPAYDAGGKDVKDYLHEVFEELYAHLGIDRPHVVGNSLGGLIALQGAVNGNAGSVTCLSPAGFWKGGRDFLYVRGLFRTMITAAGLLAPVAPLLMRYTVGKALGFSWLVQHPSRIPADHALGDFRNMLKARPAVAQLFKGAYMFEGPLPVPATIAWSEHDKVLLPYQAKVAQQRLPEAFHTVIPGVGHVPMSDDPQLVARVILDSIARAGKGTGAAA